MIHEYEQYEGQMEQNDTISIGVFSLTNYTGWLTEFRSLKISNKQNIISRKKMINWV